MVWFLLLFKWFNLNGFIIFKWVGLLFIMSGLVWCTREETKPGPLLTRAKVLKFKKGIH